MDIALLEQKDWDFVGVKTNSLTHSLHPYPAKYIPQIPRSLISELSNQGEIIADIFCGSGTTLVEANVLGRNAIGIDANPLACLISEAKTIRLAIEDESLLRDLAQRARFLASKISLDTPLLKSEPFQSMAYRPSDDAINFWFEPFVVEELAEILSWCKQLRTNESQKVAFVTFSSIIVNVSKQDSDTRYVRRDKRIKPGDTSRRFALALEKAISSTIEFNRQLDAHVTCRVFHSDILSLPMMDQFDLMVCSPPYPNAYSYHLYHMTRMIWLGMDYLEFKRQEIGSHRKYSKANSSIETFEKEMALIFGWLSRHLRPQRYACFVIGNSTIRGQRIDNAELLSRIACLQGFHEVTRITRRMQASKKSFNPSIGKIKEENIVIFQQGG